MRKWLKSVGIGVVALLLTTLGISASDSVQGLSGSLVGTLLRGEQVMGCPAGTAELLMGERVLCVDMFEASTGTSCPKPDPKTLQESEQNIGTGSCSPVSQEGGVPWRFVNLSQAQRACANAGKRLLTNEEWYRAALGTAPDNPECTTETMNAPIASRISTCKSTVGAYDMVGNVWEWVDAEVTNGEYRERPMPETGYVAGVDADGVALTTQAETPDVLYGEDYFWHSREGVRGMIRGGFYGSENDGGLYALNASVDLGFGSAGVGFRCVQDSPL